MTERSGAMWPTVLRHLACMFALLTVSRLMRAYGVPDGGALIMALTLSLVLHVLILIYQEGGFDNDDDRTGWT